MSRGIGAVMLYLQSNLCSNFAILDLFEVFSDLPEIT
jgi:hypothetical protein